MFAKTSSSKLVLGVYFTLIRYSLCVTPKNMSSTCDMPSDAGKYSVVFVTVPSVEIGKKIGHGLVKNKLAACVNIVPEVTSIYEWKGEINEDNEALLKIKTRTSLIDKLTDFVKLNHPYEVCEVIAIPIQNGNPPYLKWISENTLGE